MDPQLLAQLMAMFGGGQSLFGAKSGKGPPSLTPNDPWAFLKQQKPVFDAQAQQPAMAPGYGTPAPPAPPLFQPQSTPPPTSSQPWMQRAQPGGEVQSMRRFQPFNMGDFQSRSGMRY